MSSSLPRRPALDVLAGVAGEAAGDPLDKPLSLKDIAKGALWARAKVTWERAPARLERALRGAALSRMREERTARTRWEIVRWLLYGFVHTGDVRCANEVLHYLDHQPHAKVRAGVLEALRASRAESGHLTLRSGWSLNAELDDPLPCPKLKIGLVGPPHLFVRHAGALAAEGHEVRLYLLPDHPDRLRRMFVRRGPWLPAYWARGGRDSVRVLPRKLDEAGTFLRDEGLDVGFHNVGFILRESFFGAFRLGLLNDHWGPLPGVRGIDTVLWTLAYGETPTATVHVVDKGVDTGPIFDVQRYPVATEQAAIAAMKEDQPVRVLRAVRRLAQGEAVANPFAAGGQHFRMHPDVRSLVFDAA